MTDSFDLIALIAKVGKNLADNLFTKKLKEKDVEKIIAKYTSSLQHKELLKERFFVVISENQELVFNEKGEIYIKNSVLTKKDLEEKLIELMQKQITKPKLEFVLPETKEPLKNPQNISELEQIEQIKNKHKMLYGE